MPDHVSTIPAPRTIDPAPANPADDTVQADGWWPALSIADFRAQHRLTGEITDIRIRKALRTGMQTALIDLGEWGVLQRTHGYESLADVPALQIDGVSHYQLCWERAVMALAKDELTKEYRDYDATGAGERNTAFLDDTQVDLRAAAQFAIRDLLGRPRHYAKLI